MPGTRMDVHDARLVYGCMGLGGGWDTEPYTADDIAQAEAAVDAARQAGITVFDLADIYQHGKSEAVFGEVLDRNPELRGQIVLQTKCGIRLPAEHQVGRYDLRGATIARRVEESLHRLRTDVIDVLLLHRPDPLTPPAEIAAALTDLHGQGLVRQFGVSNMSGAQIAHLQAHLDLPLVVNQLEMSLDHRDWIESEVLVNTSALAHNGFPHGTLQFCSAHGIQLQAWGALARGRFTGPDSGQAGQLVAELARSKGTTAETIVLWWLQRHPAAIAPVVGTTRPDRIHACRDAVLREPDLTHQEWYELWVAARGAPLP
ncbi:aldo/keto reductase [Streptomyces smyrnaeus]|nr:aldo/keto reductase [Streptomyces smyrnaeus]